MPMMCTCSSPKSTSSWPWNRCQIRVRLESPERFIKQSHEISKGMLVQRLQWVGNCCVALCFLHVEDLKDVISVSLGTDTIPLRLIFVGNLTRLRSQEVVRIMPSSFNCCWYNCWYCWVWNFLGWWFGMLRYSPVVKRQLPLDSSSNQRGWNMMKQAFWNRDHLQGSSWLWLAMYLLPAIVNTITVYHQFGSQGGSCARSDGVPDTWNSENGKWAPKERNQVARNDRLIDFWFLEVSV